MILVRIFIIVFLTNQTIHFLDVKKTVNQTLDAAEEYFNEKAEANNSVYLGFQRFKLLIDSTQDFIIQIDKKHHIVSAYGKGSSKN